MASSQAKCCCPTCLGCTEVIPFWGEVKGGEKRCGLYPFYVITAYVNNMFDPNCCEDYALGNNWDGKLPAGAATCQYYFNSVANKIINGKHFWWAFLRPEANIWTYTLTGIFGGAGQLIWEGVHAIANPLPTDAPFIRTGGCSAVPGAIMITGTMV